MYNSAPNLVQPFSARSASRSGTPNLLVAEDISGLKAKLKNLEQMLVELGAMQHKEPHGQAENLMRMDILADKVRAQDSKLQKLSRQIEGLQSDTEAREDRIRQVEESNERGIDEVDRKCGDASLRIEDMQLLLSDHTEQLIRLRQQEPPMPKPEIGPQLESRFSVVDERCKQLETALVAVQTDNSKQRQRLADLHNSSKSDLITIIQEEQAKRKSLEKQFSTFSQDVKDTMAAMQALIQSQTLTFEAKLGNLDRLASQQPRGDEIFQSLDEVGDDVNDVASLAKRNRRQIDKLNQQIVVKDKALRRLITSVLAASKDRGGGSSKGDKPSDREPSNPFGDTGASVNFGDLENMARMMEDDDAFLGTTL